MNNVNPLPPASTHYGLGANELNSQQSAAVGMKRNTYFEGSNILLPEDLPGPEQVKQELEQNVNPEQVANIGQQIAIFLEKLGRGAMGLVVGALALVTLIPSLLIGVTLGGGIGMASEKLGLGRFSQQASKNLYTEWYNLNDHQRGFLISLIPTMTLYAFAAKNMGHPIQGKLFE